MRAFTCRTLAIAVVAVLVLAGAAVAGGQSGSYGNTGYLNSGSAYDSDSRHVTPCSAREAVSAKAGNSYRHSEGCPMAARYSRADRNCLFDALRKDHREIMSHLDAIANGRVGDRTMHWSELRQVLLPHMQAEERTLYPALQETSTGRMMGLAGEEEHAAAAGVFQKLDGGDFASDRWTARFGVLKDMIEHHVAEEQGSIFSAARRAFSGEQMRDLCAAFVEQKVAAANALPQMMQPASYQSSPPMQPSSMQSMYEQGTGFDTLQTQNMELRCPQCGRSMGTVCVNEQSCIDYDNETPTSTQAPATMDQNQMNQPAPTPTPAPAPTATGAEQPAPPMMDQMGTMHCPGCGAVMGTVCPYAPNGMQTPSGTGNSGAMNNNTGTSTSTGATNNNATTGTDNTGTTKY